MSDTDWPALFRSMQEQLGMLQAEFIQLKDISVSEASLHDTLQSALTAQLSIGWSFGPLPCLRDIGWLRVLAPAFTASVGYWDSPVLRGLCGTMVLCSCYSMGFVVPTGLFLLVFYEL